MREATYNFVCDYLMYGERCGTTGQTQDYYGLPDGWSRITMSNGSKEEGTSEVHACPHHTDILREDVFYNQKLQDEAKANEVKSR